MNDLFESIAEAKSEREAIMIESGVADAIENAADDIHRCEVASVIRQYFPNGKKAAEYFDLVEKKRGKVAADKLRADCRVAWAKRRDEMTGQA